MFLEAWKCLGELRAVSAIGPWLASMARNRARRLAATARVRGQQVELEGVVAPDLSAADAAGVGQEQLLAHLANLPSAFRLPLTMRLVEGLPGPEIARLLDRPPASVRVSLHRGMELLRARLRRESELS